MFTELHRQSILTAASIMLTGFYCLEEMGFIPSKNQDWNRPKNKGVAKI